MRKCANISPYMRRRPLVIYDFATAPLWISFYEEKLISFLSVYCVLDALVSADAVELEGGEPRDGVVLEGGLHIDGRLRQVEVHPKHQEQVIKSNRWQHFARK
jgi:hypothetical protein